MAEERGESPRRKHYYYGQWRDKPKPARPFSSILGWHLDHMERDGWRVSEFVRRMQTIDPESKIQRQAVHAYLQGKTRPGNEHIHLMAKTLGVSVEDLVEREGLQIVVEDGRNRDVARVRFVSDSFAEISINARVPDHIARSIITLIRAADADLEGASEPLAAETASIRKVKKRN